MSKKEYLCRAKTTAMNEQIRQIAARLRGMRDAVDMTAAEVAEACNISEADLLRYESGETDIPMNFICLFAKYFRVEPSTIFSGEEAYMNSYFLCRKGKGQSVSRSNAYKYQALAMGFKNAKAEPFIVTVEPDEDPDKPMHLNSHPSQEFNLVMEGTLLLQVDGKQLVLEEGDSLYFDSTKLHGMKALNGKRVRFLAIIL